MVDTQRAAPAANEPETYLSDAAKELLAKIRFIENSDPPKVIDRFYAILSILDSKASGLLSANALFIAVVTFLFGGAITGSSAGSGASGGSGQTGNSLAVFSYIDLILFGASSTFCLGIVRISWPFMAKMKAKSGGYDVASEQPHLAREAVRRTGYYQTAWFLTLAGLGILAILAFPKGA